VAVLEGTATAPVAFVALRPGAIADTKYAIAAVSPAAPQINTRRTWLTRINAASRSSRAIDRSRPEAIRLLAVVTLTNIPAVDHSSLRTG